MIVYQLTGSEREQVRAVIQGMIESGMTREEAWTEFESLLTANFMAAERRYAEQQLMPSAKFSHPWKGCPR